MKNLLKTATPIILLSAITNAHAVGDGFYAAAGYGFSDQSSSDNRGSFNTAFTTGSVTGVTPPLSLPADTAVGWTTEFDDGQTFSLALGLKNDANRYELEYSQTQADVETHTDVVAADLALGAIDAGLLISGNVGDLGVSVAGLVADGRGDIETSSLFLNYFRDFDNDSAFTPFLGLGIGYADTDVVYEPSGVSIINDSDSGFAYQVMGGAAYSITDNFDLVGTIRYRDFGDAEVEASLFPARFDIENQATQFELGIRYGF